MNIEKLEEMWAIDCVIDQNRLDDVTVACAKLHAKYLAIFNTVKMKLKKYESDYATERHTRWKWYTGKMTKDEMDKHGLDYDPWYGGSKPMKSEISSYIEADPVLSKIQLKIEYYKIMTSMIEEILGNIRWRNSAIKNILDWKKFTSGV
jgi:hypothetical protein